MIAECSTKGRSTGRNLQPDDEIVIPQDDLNVITWETNFGDFESGRRNTTNELPTERAENTSDAADIAEQPDHILTDVDLRSTRRDVTEEILPDQKMHESDDESTPDVKTSSGGAILSCPKYYKVKMTECTLKMKALGKEDTTFALTPPPTTLKNTETSQNIKLRSPFPAICPQGHVFYLGLF